MGNQTQILEVHNNNQILILEVHNSKIKIMDPHKIVVAKQIKIDQAHLKIPRVVNKMEIVLVSN